MNRSKGSNASRHPRSTKLSKNPSKQRVLRRLHSSKQSSISTPRPAIQTPSLNSRRVFESPHIAPQLATSSPLSTQSAHYHLSNPNKSLLPSLNQPLSTLPQTTIRLINHHPPDFSLHLRHQSKRCLATPHKPNQSSIDLQKFEKMVEQEAHNPDSFFDVDPNDEDDGPMTDPEDPVAYAREFDKDDVKPEFFNPQTHPLEFITANLLQAEVEGVSIFPVYLRSHVLNKIVQTALKVQNNLPPNQFLDGPMVTGIITDVLTTFAPELCRTHEHALNILFPIAPRLGDVVQIPGVPGHCLVAKREYMDNRDDYPDGQPDDDTEVGRFMIITYQCLHPSLKLKNYVSRHPFDREVYALSAAQDEKGLERLMHERGMIDMYSGRIANIQEQKGRVDNLPSHSTPLSIASRADPNQVALRTPAQDAAFQAKVQKEQARLGAQSYNRQQRLLQRPHVPDLPSQELLQIPDLSSPPPAASKSAPLPLPGHVDSSTPSSTSNIQPYKPNYTPALKTPPIPREQKEYFQSFVVTGDKAAVLYKKLLLNLARDGGLEDDRFAQFEQRPGSQNQKQITQPKNRPIEATLMDIHNHGALNAKMTASGAQYGPDAFLTPEFISANLTTSAAVPSKVISIQEEGRLRREMDQGLGVAVGAAKQQSKAFDQYRQLKLDRAAEFKKMRDEQETQLYSEVHAKASAHKSEIEALTARFNHLVDFYVKLGKSPEEAQALADTQFDPETGSLYDDENSIEQVLLGTFDLEKQQEEQPVQIEPDLSSINDHARSQYKALPEKYKTKYKHILVKDGPGAGLPDPMLIERGEDLFEIYPNANVALMDFLSDQWSLMVKEKEEQDQLKIAQQVQEEDENYQRKMAEVRKDPELGPRQEFLDEAQKSSGYKMALPRDVEGTRFRLLAAVAAAGSEAFTADYVTELFEKVVANKNPQSLFSNHIPLQQITSEPDFYFNHLPKHGAEASPAQLDEDAMLDIDQETIEFAAPKPSLTPQLTPEGYVKVGGELLTQMEYAEQVFGAKPIPLEESNVVTPKIKSMIRSHYKHRENLHKKNELDKLNKIMNPSRQTRRFSTMLNQPIPLCSKQAPSQHSRAFQDRSSVKL